MYVRTNIFSIIIYPLLFRKLGYNNLRKNLLLIPIVEGTEGKFSPRFFFTQDNFALMSGLSGSMWLPNNKLLIAYSCPQ